MKKAEERRGKEEKDERKLPALSSSHIHLYLSITFPFLLFLSSFLSFYHSSPFCCAPPLSDSYAAIVGGFVDQALSDLTGGFPMRIDLTKPETKQDVSAEDREKGREGVLDLPKQEDSKM